MPIKKIGILALRAIRWLTRQKNSLEKRRGKLRAGLQAAKMAYAIFRAQGLESKRLEGFFKGLARVEETVGAHTSAWRRIDRGKPGESVTLTPAEVKYLKAFTKQFDRWLKRDLD